MASNTFDLKLVV